MIETEGIAGAAWVTDGRRGAGKTLDKPFGTQTRRHRRFVPVDQAVLITFETGEVARARMVNASVAGVAVEVNLGGRPPRSVTKVGGRAVRAGRAIALGAVFLFAGPINEGARGLGHVP